VKLTLFLDLSCIGYLGKIPELKTGSHKKLPKRDLRDDKDPDRRQETMTIEQGNSGSAPEYTALVYKTGMRDQSVMI